VLYPRYYGSTRLEPLWALINYLILGLNNHQINPIGKAFFWRGVLSGNSHGDGDSYSFRGLAKYVRRAYVAWVDC